MKPITCIMIMLLVCTTGLAVTLVYKQHHQRQLVIQLMRLEQERNELHIEYGRLQLEQATLGRITRIDELARQQLGMHPVRAADVKVIQP